MNNKNEYICPICGEGTLWTDFTDGTKWGRAYCDRCDCGGPEVLTGYDENIDAPWRADAIKQFVDVVNAHVIKRCEVEGMNREEAAVYVWETYEWCMREYENARADKGMMSKTKEAFDLAIAALRSGWVRTSERLPTATDRMTCTNGNDTIPDRTASYTIPQMASNNVVINIVTGGSEELAHTQTDTQHAKKITSNALAGTDYADRLRWLLSQAERIVHVDTEDRAAVERACDALEGRIDKAPGFDSVRR